MNNTRREEIDAAAKTMEELKNEVEAIAYAEREYFDDMPENFQGTERGQRADEVATELEDIAQELEDLLERLNECK